MLEVRGRIISNHLKVSLVLSRRGILQAGRFFQCAGRTSCSLQSDLASLSSVLMPTQFPTLYPSLLVGCAHQTHMQQSGLEMIVQSYVISLKEQSVRCVCQQKTREVLKSHDEEELVCAGTYNSAHMVEHHGYRVRTFHNSQSCFVCLHEAHVNLLPGVSREHTVASPGQPPGQP